MTKGNGLFIMFIILRICFLQTLRFCLLKTLTDGLEWCGLLWCFYQLFWLSFWRHPFTAEHPLLSKWFNATFLQIWWRNKLTWPEGKYISVTFHFWVNCCFKTEVPRFWLAILNIWTLWLCQSSQCHHFSKCVICKGNWKGSSIVRMILNVNLWNDQSLLCINMISHWHTFH